MRECSVGITPDSPAAAGEASAADGHARFRSRRGQAQSPNGSHESREAFERRVSVPPRWLRQPRHGDGAWRERHTLASVSATQEVLGRAPSVGSDRWRSRWSRPGWSWETLRNLQVRSADIPAGRSRSPRPWCSVLGNWHCPSRWRSSSQTLRRTVRGVGSQRTEADDEPS